MNDKDVDIIYVGNVHSFRKEIGEKVLKAKKHCLLEKPFTCNVADAEYLIGLAKERNLFLMEVSFIIIYIKLVFLLVKTSNIMFWAHEYNIISEHLNIGYVDSILPCC